MNATPFTIHVDDEALDDLRARLSNTKWPKPLSKQGWAHGVDVDYLQELFRYWSTDFNWRAQEQSLNSFDQFTADIDDQQVHFLHLRGRGARPLPLMLIHGWPSSFTEFLKLAPLLTDPSAEGTEAVDSFDIVVPSLPGFAFSTPLNGSDTSTPDSMAALLTRLMTDCLGYSQFGVQGQDIGAAVALSMAGQFPTSIIGLHLTGVLAFPPEGQPLSAEGQEFQARRERWSREQGGYSHQQGTYPQTLAFGLCDSPAGLAAWIIDKFRAWSDCDGDVERRFTKDELLTNVMIYWITNSINTSFLFYYASQRQPGSFLQGKEVPVGVALFPKENPITGPRAWAEATYNITRWTEMPRGGHFPAHEEPDLLAAELREFFRPLRRRSP